jgi:hypothetical protein
MTSTYDFSYFVKNAYKAITLLNSINRLVIAKYMQCVFCAVGTAFFTLFTGIP